ncbi:MAG: DUF3987 domain-containing protein [Paludibacteraceae bacterium]|nr:DUF3987 domain-containing protein [Paludibacteraceae bacterium]MBR4705237.1 DUF3987 domain-containing protein [Paludibacteraceae bacterium]
MIQNLQSAMEAEQDLHIAKHIEPENLPAMIQPIMSLAQSDAERDMLLLSLLTAAGSCMPNLYFRYGLTGKKYYPNLQCFIVGSAACGKGIANLALELVSKVHEAAPLVIAGDSSYPGFYKQLERQNGRGYIHESEGSVITDVWRTSVTNYNTALRKAAEHEPITRNRANNSSCIACPQLSVLLTGTFSQYKALVPSIENGYFSRLLTLIVNDQQAFSHRYVEPASGSNGVMSLAAERLYELCQALYKSRPIEFSLTAEQRARLGQHLETAYPALMQVLGVNFHSVVLRMAVHIERIAMILSALRMADKLSVISHQYSDFHCSDVDYQTAEMIGNKLILHMAAAYRMIKGAEEVSVPKVQPLDQRQMLLSLLPEEFETKTLLEEAKSQGISRRTVIYWNDEWQQTGVVQKIRHGVYRKCLASA